MAVLGVNYMGGTTNTIHGTLACTHTHTSLAEAPNGHNMRVQSWDRSDAIPTLSQTLSSSVRQGHCQQVQKYSLYVSLLCPIPSVILFYRVRSDNSKKAISSA